MPSLKLAENYGPFGGARRSAGDETPMSVCFSSAVNGTGGTKRLRSRSNARKLLARGGGGRMDPPMHLMVCVKTVFSMQCRHQDLHKDSARRLLGTT